MEDKLPKVVSNRKKRLGRGYGSGKGGHTVGRGQKGQKSRGKVGILFEGYKMIKSFIKRLPLRRGKGKFKSKNELMIINLKHLEILPSGTLVNVENLVKWGLVNEKDAKLFGVKILGDGEISKKLKIALPISKSALKKVEKAGGEIVNK